MRPDVIQTSRRKILKAAAGGGLALAASPAPSAPAIIEGTPELRWRMTSSFPPSLDTIHGAGKVFCKAVADMTDNKFQIQLFAAGDGVCGLLICWLGLGNGRTHPTIVVGLDGDGCGRRFDLCLLAADDDFAGGVFRNGRARQLGQLRDSRCCLERCAAGDRRINRRGFESDALLNPVRDHAQRRAIIAQRTHAGAHGRLDPRHVLRLGRNGCGRCQIRGEFFCVDEFDLDQRISLPSR